MTQEEAMRNIEENVKIKLDEIREDVSQNQGEICVCFRELVSRPRDRGCFGVGTPNFYHLESGIVAGELEKFDEKDHLRYKTIDLFGFDRCSGDEYSIMANYGIPVKQLFSKDGSTSINLHIRSKRLKEVKKGKIVFATYEFPKVKKNVDSVSRTSMNYSALNSIDFLFGEKSVRDYLGSHKNVDSRGIDDFIQLIAVSGELEKRVGDNKEQERRNLADELLIFVSRLCGLDREVESIEERVLNASLSAGPGWESWSLYEKEVYQYDSYNTGLRAQINNTINFIEGKIRKSGEIGLGELTYISGRCLGFPGEVTPSEYLDNYKEEILPRIRERLGKLDSSLADKRRKANKR